MHSAICRIRRERLEILLAEEGRALRRDGDARRRLGPLRIDLAVLYHDFVSGEARDVLAILTRFRLVQQQAGMFVRYEPPQEPRSPT